VILVVLDPMWEQDAQFGQVVRLGLCFLFVRVSGVVMVMVVLFPFRQVCIR